MIRTVLVGQAGLQLEALAEALASDGGIECRQLPLKEVLDSGPFESPETGDVVVLLDFADEQSQKGELLPRVKRAFPNSRAIFLTDVEDRQLAIALLRRGAWGVFPKSGSVVTLRRAICAVAAGEVWIDRRSSSDVIRKIIESKPLSREEHGAAPLLSKRERQILALIALGMKNKDISKKVSISELTVKVHVNSIFRKIGVKDRLQAALYAIRNGIVQERIPID
jgi:DNA-binding NarL/FixJ family response regulator